MEYAKILLREADPLEDVLAAVEKVDASVVVLQCPRECALLERVADVRTLVKNAAAAEKSVSLVVEREWQRQALDQHGVRVFAGMPAQFLPGESREIPEILEVQHAERNPDDVPPPVEFVKQRVRPESRSYRGPIFFAVLVLGVLGCIGWLWFRPHATIEIKPRISAVPVIQNVIVTLPEAEVPEVDQGLPQMSGIMVETEVVGNELITSGGRKYDIENARGKLSIFNESPREKFFLPSRLSTEDGVIFRFSEEITVPPHNGTRAGELVVTVEADAFDADGRPVGGRGNIPAATELSFPALRDDSREIWYARTNRGPLVGGSTLTHYFVEETDRERAQKQLEENFFERGTERLRAEMSQRSTREKKQYVLLDQPTMLQPEYAEFVFPDELIGTEAEKFEVSGGMRLQGLVFDQAGAEDVLRQKLLETLDDRQRLLDIDPQSAEYQVLDQDGFPDEGWVKLSVKMIGVKMLDLEAQTIDAQLWRKKLRDQLVGAEADTARSLLLNTPEIEQVFDVRLRPWWQRRLPNDPEKIQFKLRTE